MTLKVSIATGSVWAAARLP